MAVPEVSVVVPTYTRSGELRRLLDSLDALECDRPFEVIIVDDASPDDTPEVVQEWISRPASFEKRYYRLEKNSGPARARNKGTREARGRYVAYTDSDCVVTPDWLTHLANPGQFSEKIAGVGGKVLPLNPKGLISRYNSFHRILEPPESGIYLVSCNCCFVRELVMDAGGFDEDVSKAGGEDIALCIKLNLKGYHFCYQPNAVLYHDYRENLGNFRRTWFNYGEGTAFATSRHLPPDLANPHNLDPDNPEGGWLGNPLHPFHMGRRPHRVWLWFRMGRHRGIPISDSILFSYLGFIQIDSYRKGWAVGTARARATTEHGGSRDS